MQCRKCKKEFVPSNSQIKKRDYICLICRRVYDKGWRLKRLALGLKVRGDSPSKEWWDNYYKEYYSRPEIKKRRLEQAKKYREDPNLRFKHLARWLTRRAIKQGKLFKENCVNCGNEKVQAHHVDYYRPLLIVWLCAKCHRGEHKKAEGTL